MTPYAIYYEPEIKSRTVQGERTRDRVRIEERREREKTMGECMDHGGRIDSSNSLGRVKLGYGTKKESP